MIMIETIKQWLKAHNLDTDVHFYTQEEWVKWGETYGIEADFTITTEGAFYTLLNDPYGKSAYALINEFSLLLDGFGYWYEQGYSWSIHLYKKEDPSLRKGK